METDHILRAIKKIYEVNGTENEINETVNFLKKNFPHAKIIDLIFHDFRDLTPEQIVEEANKREADYIREAGAQGGQARDLP
jgi:hypothetical protein